jgi:hypothetical protein
MFVHVSSSAARRAALAAAIGLLLAAGMGCSQVRHDPTYTVRRTTTPVRIDADWTKPVWAETPAVTLTHAMGDPPEHRPAVQAKVRYDDERLYVIFHVEDRYVRAVAQHDQTAVYRDSCVEFFFTPGEDVTAGYFNLEMNCGGTMLFHFQHRPRGHPTPLRPEDLARVQRAASMPRIVDPEISDPVTWTVEYAIPTALLAAYCPSAVAPAPGVGWRANFYKCASATSHPHWLTWARVDRPRPDFHVPAFFGTLRFE